MSNEGLASEIGALVESQLDGRATPDEQARLEALVCSDDAARVIYLQYIEDCALLGALARPQADPQAGSLTFAAISLPQDENVAGAQAASLWGRLWPTERWLDALPVAMFATLMLAVGIFMGRGMLGPDQRPNVTDRPADDNARSVEKANAPALPSERVQVATLVEAAQCQWIESPPDFRPGSLVFEGERLHLGSGTALLVLRTGASLVIEGRAVLTMAQPARLKLTLGTISARVPREAVGFSVETPVATVVDLGTVFSVSVDRADAVDVHVFSGEVALCGRPASGSVRSQRLIAGEARRMPAADPATWSDIPLLEAHRFEAAKARALGEVASGVTTTVPVAEASGDLTRWRAILDESFAKANLAPQRWQELVAPIPPSRQGKIKVRPATRPSPEGLRLTNGAGVLTAGPLEVPPGATYRVTAEATIKHKKDCLQLFLRARPATAEWTEQTAEHGVASRIGEGMICIFGAHTSESSRSIGILSSHPAQHEPTAVTLDCPEPEIGRRYRLQATDDGQSLRFEVELLGPGGWHREVELPIPPQLLADGAGHAGLGNWGPWTDEPFVSVLQSISIQQESAN